ncbi:MAG: AbrB/MazE/SpoVT family DNA-binding domain-containing protein [Betaproteobacteria bacterium]|nr:AbrB/MazE/SpoVT family DNA-binding domain-containing protein [Betaproteobacteria bacterium]
MRSTLTERGQTVVPAAVRKHFSLTPSDRLEWIIEGDSLRVTPVHADPIEAFRGRGKGGAADRLLAERHADGEGE